eukprot:6603904-Alexandrium_andersonii.AAC.1
MPQPRPDVASCRASRLPHVFWRVGSRVAVDAPPSQWQRSARPFFAPRGANDVARNNPVGGP